MTEYAYSNKASEPCLSSYDENGVLDGGLQYDITQSSISSASLDGLRWDEDLEKITAFFDGTLSSGDESTLNTIMEEY